MDVSEYKWETRFETAQDLMIHTFTPRVTVVTNIKTGLIKVVKDGITIDRIDGSGMPMEQYEQFLLRTQTEANQLPSINQ